MPRSTMLLYIYIFPSLQISGLTQLKYLQLSTNYLSAPIPSSVSINAFLGYPNLMPLGMHRSISVLTNTMICEHDHIVNTCCISAHVVGVVIYMIQCMGVVNALASILDFCIAAHF